MTVSNDGMRERVLRSMGLPRLPAGEGRRVMARGAAALAALLAVALVALAAALPWLASLPR